MASRILAQLLVAGGTAIFRAGTQAWHQALQNAQRTGVAGEAVNRATRGGGLTAQEARMILGVEEGMPWPEVVKRYKHLFEVNEKHGSFYLQSKVYRAWEQLDRDYTDAGLKAPDEPGSAPGAGDQQQQRIDERQDKAQ